MLKPISAGSLNGLQVGSRLINQLHLRRLTNRSTMPIIFINKLRKQQLRDPMKSHFYHLKEVISGNGPFQNGYIKSDNTNCNRSHYWGLQRPSAVFGISERCCRGMTNAKFPLRLMYTSPKSYASSTCLAMLPRRRACSCACFLPKSFISQCINLLRAQSLDLIGTPADQ